MRVLDLDLDFFLDVTHTSGDIEGTTHLDYGQPWTESETREFLESQCALSQTTKMPGAVFGNHYEVFYYWQELLRTGRLVAPFEVIHVDAHSDLGGDSSWLHILKDTLQKAPVERCEGLKEGFSGLHCGSFLAFAIAARWLKGIEFVLHPDWRDDIPEMFLQKFGSGAATSGLHGRTTGRVIIQMRRYSKRDLEQLIFSLKDLVALTPEELEPPVPMDLVPAEQFRNTRTFDFVTLCKSPTFTPKASDNLIPVIEDYIDTRRGSV